MQYFRCILMYFTVLLFISLGLTGYANDNMLLGGRTASMGGAGAAAGSDSSVPYINPACIAQISDNVFSLSTNFYTWQNSNVDNFFQVNDLPSGTTGFEEQKYRSESFSGFPGTASWFKKFGDGITCSFSAIVPSFTRDHFYGNAKYTIPTVPYDSSNIAIYEYKNTDSEYYFGPGIAMNINGISIGASVFLLYRESQVDHQYNLAYWFPSTSRMAGLSILNSQSSKTWGIAPIIGIRYPYSNALTYGLTITLPVMNVNGEYTEFEEIYSIGDETFTDDYDRVSTFSGKGKAVYNKPMKVRCGVSYGLKNQITFSLDAEVLFAKKNVTDSSAKGMRQSRKQAIIVEQYNITVDNSMDESGAVRLYFGSEWYFSNTRCLRAGLFYMPSANQKLQQTLYDYYNMRVDYWGITAGYGNTSDMGDVSIGLVLSIGNGETGGAQYWKTGDSFAPVDVKSISLTMIFSGQVEFSKI